MGKISSYGIKQQTQATTVVDFAAEQISLLGYAVVDGGYSPGEVEAFGRAFDSARVAMEMRHGGRTALETIDEHNTIRLPMLYDDLFLKLAMNDNIVELCGKLISDYFVLNQQNGISNPGGSARYNQGSYHRDLPFQHFTSSRPLAINALFCIDDFTVENGATFVVPGSHKQEAFPSDGSVAALQIQVPARAGSFIVLDCMTYHSGGVNRTERERRAVNHVYTIPLLKQQIDFPNALQDDFTADPKARQLLGYGLSVPADVESFYRSRARR
ncbi:MULTISPECIES: phytanoyl-CoA dioxygenase family protein [unclassified Rhizobium]|uniref:phytanoyl-CoA dioxygenase family protein n=1 Tax=unclassified Rhizobium TaxID=2613769 RepID=UPI0007EB2A92|nr:MULTISPECIES: phytanoyl-CoA dioxygenase family protein [unclassified Rhizobium]ANK88019.1 phytanoyl-CoA dioxygenase protein [Rhizobium sp. N731]ANL18265.1 phytanoyl-CoA dioxygenase protein [Rhizobium sp. N1314]